MNLLQIIGSLVAVLAVIAAVKLLGLGRAQLAGPSEACENAEAMVHGFTATDAIVCGEGNGALVAGDKGDFVVLKRLGSYYAARKLLPPIHTAERDDNCPPYRERRPLFRARQPDLSRRGEPHRVAAAARAQRMSELPNPVDYAVPAFVALMLVEIWLVRRRKQTRAYSPGDTATSLFLGLGSTVAGVLSAGLVYALATWVHTFALFDIGMDLRAGGGRGSSAS